MRATRKQRSTRLPEARAAPAHQVCLCVRIVAGRPANRIHQLVPESGHIHGDAWACHGQASLIASPLRMPRLDWRRQAAVQAGGIGGTAPATWTS